MNYDPRIAHETEHGRWIATHGEDVWNWSSAAGRIRWRRRADMFAEFLGCGGLKVLEVGCGTGLFTAEICRTNNNITAIDISEELIALARSRVGAANVRFLVENAYATKMDDESFDAVVGSSSLHHLDVDRALAEMRRLLKPGGRVMFTEPNMLNPQIALQKNIPFLKRLAGDSPDETAFVRFALAKKLRATGFRDVSIIPFDFVHPSIPRLLLGTGVSFLGFFEKVPLLREIAGSLVIRASK